MAFSAAFSPRQQIYRMAANRCPRLSATPRNNVQYSIQGRGECPGRRQKDTSAFRRFLCLPLVLLLQKFVPLLSCIQNVQPFYIAEPFALQREKTSRGPSRSGVLMYTAIPSIAVVDAVIEFCGLWLLTDSVRFCCVYNVVGL